jgi:hypothetical protein
LHASLIETVGGMSVMPFVSDETSTPKSKNP